MKIFLCKIFGHKLRIAMNSEELWAKCDRKDCKYQEDIPESRELEAYEKIKKRDWSWKSSV